MDHPSIDDMPRVAAFNVGLNDGLDARQQHGKAYAERCAELHARLLSEFSSVNWHWYVDGYRRAVSW